MRTDVENLVSRETQWKKTSVYENTVSSISLLLLLVIYSISMHLFDDFLRIVTITQKLDLKLITMTVIRAHLRRVSSVKCQVYEWHQTFFPSIVKLFISFSYFELRSHYRDGIKTLK